MRALPSAGARDLAHHHLVGLPVVPARAPAPPPASWSLPNTTGTRPLALRPIESQRVDAGPWFAGLTPLLRRAIFEVARVQHVRRGARLVQAGQVANDWVGVAGGALSLVSSGPSGKAHTLELLGPGDWYGDIALLDGSTADLGIQAHTQSTVLLVSRDALAQLVADHAELRPALLHLDCRRLRHMFRRWEEVQTLPLAQRVALQLQRLLRQFGRPVPMSAISDPARQIEVALSQGDLASLLWASRQRINGVLRVLQAEGVLGSSHGRIVVLQPDALAAVAQGRRVLEA